MMKTAIVLSGGGAKAAFQVGVLSKLRLPDVICGTSAGALNAAAYAHVGKSGLLDFWHGIKSWRDLYSVNLSSLVMSSDGLLNSAPLRKKIDQALSSRPLCEVIVTRVNLETGALHYAYSHGPDFADAVEGSAAIPFVVSPVKGYSDGGLREICPLKKLIDYGCDRIIAVLCTPWGQDPAPWKPQRKFLRIAEIGQRALDICLHEILVNDLVDCMQKNTEEGKRKISIEVYAPDRLLLESFDFDREKINAAIEQGMTATPIALSSVLSVVS